MADVLRASHDTDPQSLRGPMLVFDDATGQVTETATALGVEVVRWDPRAGGPHPARAWPPDVEAASCVVRLPKGRDHARMVLEGALSRVASGGPVYLYGHNDEGIRSAGRDLETFCDAVRTVETRRHCRVWRGRRTAGALRSDLDAFAEPVTLALPAGDAEAVSFPGLFAHGRLDAATALLAQALPRVRPEACVLDYGCGLGTLLLAVRARLPRATLHGLDAEALALEAARRNVPDATLHLGTRLADLPDDLRFDLIVSNPPIHDGHARDTRAAEAFARDAARRLTRRGQVLAVGQRTLPLGRWLEQGFDEVEIAAENASFCVWRAAVPGRRRESGRRERRGRVRLP